MVMLLVVVELLNVNHCISPAAKF